MTPATCLSMAGFAFAASVSPGPVNIVALASGLHHGVRAGLRHVTGATLAFVLLLLLAGLGLIGFVQRWPAMALAMRWGGAAFLVYMAIGLWRAQGAIADGPAKDSPSFVRGATMQWLNPKAWIAALAGSAAYGGGDPAQLWIFVTIYGLICFPCLTLWVVAGAYLRDSLQKPGRVRLFNRLMAMLLALSAGTVAVG